MKIIFRLSEAKDRDLINHIKEIKKTYNTSNRSKAMRIILQKSMEQNNLEKSVKAIEKNQNELLNYLVDLKEVSSKNKQNLNSLMKGLYNVFNQSPMTFETTKKNIKNPFNEVNNEKSINNNEEDDVNNEKYENILNNIDDNPLC